MKNINQSIESVAQKTKENNKGKVKKIDKSEVIRILKFVGFSISAGVIQISSFEILYHAVNWNNWWACYLISIVLSVIWNFTFNRKFTFQSANNVYIAMSWTLAYYIVFIPISVFGGDALENIGWHGTLVTVLMMLINFVTEFLWQRFFVFKKSINTKPLSKTVDILVDEITFKKLLLNEKNICAIPLSAKYKDLNEGDKLSFKNIENVKEKMKVKIEKLNKFLTVEEFQKFYTNSLTILELKDISLKSGVKKGIDDIVEQEQGGVLAVEVIKINAKK